MPNDSDDASLVLQYLGLPNDHQPSPVADPIVFLQQNLRSLPPHLLYIFASITTPKQRTVIPEIRNRRLKYASTHPDPLSFEAARRTWPNLWPERDRCLQQDENINEKLWAEKDFLDGQKQHVGKLGTLLGNYAEEREAERVLGLRRQAAEAEFVPEEEEDSDDSDNDITGSPLSDDSPEEKRQYFERTVRERFIYGLLDNIDYDSVDWDDQWDVDNDRSDEERWFDDEEES